MKPCSENPDHVFVAFVHAAKHNFGDEAFDPVESFIERAWNQCRNDTDPQWPEIREHVRAQWPIRQPAHP